MGHFEYVGTQGTGTQSTDQKAEAMALVQGL
jgi:hypothetical protein